MLADLLFCLFTPYLRRLFFALHSISARLTNWIADYTNMQFPSPRSAFVSKPWIIAPVVAIIFLIVKNNLRQDKICSRLFARITRYRTFFERFVRLRKSNGRDTSTTLTCFWTRFLYSDRLFFIVAHKQPKNKSLKIQSLNPCNILRNFHLTYRFFLSILSFINKFYHLSINRKWLHLVYLVNIETTLNKISSINIKIENTKYLIVCR